MAEITGFIIATQHSWESTTSYSFHNQELTRAGYVTVCPVTIQYEPLAPDLFIRAKIAALQEQQKEIRMAANQEVANIAEEIQKLSCLGYSEPEERKFGGTTYTDVIFAEVSE